MLVNLKLKSALIAVVFVALSFLFSASVAQAASVKNLAPQIIFVQSKIISVDPVQKIIVLEKGKNERSKILYTKTTNFLIYSGSERLDAAETDFKVGDNFFAYVGYYPYHSDYYVAGFLAKTILPTTTISVAVKATATPKPAVTKPAPKPVAKKTTTPVKKTTPAPASVPKKTTVVAAPKPTPPRASAPAATLPPASVAQPAPPVAVSTTSPATNSPVPAATSTAPTTASPPATTPSAPVFAINSPPARPLGSSACQALPAPTGSTVTVANFNELLAALKSANNNGGNVTILLKDGTYNLKSLLWVQANNITIRGLSGDRDKVILQGPNMKSSITHIFGIFGDNITVADMTIGQVTYHAIQVFGEDDPDNLLVHNVRFFDTGQQMLKVSTDAKKPGAIPENGVVECSLFEYTAGKGPSFYVGGIDAHRSVNWIVRDNVFKNISSPESKVAEHAIHFWNHSSGTIVERNVIINSDRGIGFGLGTSPHSGGIIRNNMIYHDSSRGDVGIGLENASDVEVYGNTIYSENSYANAIEYRFAGTSAKIYDNLTNKKIQQREGNPVGDLQNNVTTALSDWFVNPSVGDLHLKEKPPTVVGAGRAVAGLSSDIDGQTRPQGDGVDVGADEVN